VLDVGSGCGILALMVAQRHPTAHVHGIEPDQGAYLDATVNFEASPWSDRLSCSMEKMHEHRGLYDTLITNPPYFRNIPDKDDVSRDLARNRMHLEPAHLLEHAQRLLKADGTMHIILPWAEGRDFIDMAGTYGFFLNCHCHVSGTGQELRRRLMTFGRDIRSIRQENLTVRRNGKFTGEYKALTGAFYLSHPDKTH